MLSLPDQSGVYAPIERARFFWEPWLDTSDRAVKPLRDHYRKAGPCELSHRADGGVGAHALHADSEELTPSMN
jgi:hypothetical protein